MIVQPITLSLSENILQRAHQAAAVLQKPVEEVLAATLSAALPDLDDVPATLRPDLARMTWFNDQALWTVAESSLPAGKQEQLRYLVDIQNHRPLTTAEAEMLDGLRGEYGSMTLRKARAYALLSMRGGRPLLAGV